MEFSFSDMCLHVVSSLYISTVSTTQFQNFFKVVYLVNMQLYLFNILHVKNMIL